LDAQELAGIDPWPFAGTGTLDGADDDERRSVTIARLFGNQWELLVDVEGEAQPLVAVLNDGHLVSAESPSAQHTLRLTYSYIAVGLVVIASILLGVVKLLLWAIGGRA
jgi:hypothetical protein